MKLLIAALLIVSANSAFAAQYSEIAARCTLGGDFKTLGAKYNGFPNISIQKIEGTDKAIIIAIADDGFVNVEEAKIVESNGFSTFISGNIPIVMSKKDFVGSVTYKNGDYTCSLPQ